MKYWRFPVYFLPFLLFTFFCVQYVFAGSKTQEKKESIIVKLPESIRVKNISVDGNYPYLATRILRLSSFQEGEVYNEKKVVEGEERIASFFQKEGHFDTKVKITPLPNKYPQSTDLKIDIEKGHTHHLGKVTWEGNTVFEDKYLNNKLFSFFHFKFSRIKRKLKIIQQEYIEKGYVRARVKFVKAQIDPQTNKINLEVKIVENKKMDLKFVGNTWFSNATLKDQVTFFKDRGYDRFSADRSVKKLEQFYKINGFSKVIISYEYETDEKEVHILFKIFEGPRTRLKSFYFTGNESISSGKLDNVTFSEEHSITNQGFFRPENVGPDLARVEQYYEDNGFFDVEIVNDDIYLNSFEDQATVAVEIKEGPAYIVKNIDLEGVNPELLDEVTKRIEIKIDEKYERKKVVESEDKITQFYLKNGYPYMTMEWVPEMDKENKIVSVVLLIEEGPQAHIGKTIVTGTYNTKLHPIAQAVKFKEGDLYQYKDILNTQLNLTRLGVFDYVSVTPQGLDDKVSVVDVTIQLQESKRTTFDIQAGYDSDKLLSSQLLITRRNLFGMARQLQLRAIGGFEFNRLETTLFAPRIFGANWNLSNQYFVQYEDDENFNASSFGGSVGVLKNFGPDFTLFMKGQITRLDILKEESNQTALDQNLFDSTFNEVSTSLTYDTRDNYADPQRGIMTTLTSELDNDWANLDNIFGIYKLGFSNYLGFLSRLTLVNTVRVGQLHTLTGEARVPATKLFFMGGNDTIRGFEEDAINPSGGTTSVIYNVELHYRLMESIKLAAFFDAGSLTNGFTEITRDTIREGTGVGLRYITPIGPLRIDYGINVDRRADEPRSRFHFSFGYFF